MVVSVPSNSIVYLILWNVTTTFQTQIFSHFKECSHIVNIFDTTQIDFITYVQPNSAQNFTNIILSNSIGRNASIPLGEYLPTKFLSPCALTVKDITDLPGILSSSKNFEPQNATSWEPPAILGTPVKEFHVFFIRSCKDILSSVAWPLMRKIYRSFIVQSCEGSLKLFRITSNGRSVTNFGELFPTKFSKRIFVPFPNFNLEPFYVVTCATCPTAVDRYKNTGMWSNALVAAIYEFSILINGTFEADEVLSYPRDDPGEDGNWDDWFQPVIEGSAAVTLLHRPTTQKSRLAYNTLPGSYDGVVFITAKPKRVPGSQNLFKLFSPFSIHIWIACSMSVVFMFGAIELIIKIRSHGRLENFIDESENTHFAFVPRTAMGQTSGQKPRHLHRLTLAALLKPMVEQGALDSPLFLQNIQNESLHRILLSIWFLGAIILVNFYTSVMTSQIVLPVFTNPPTTFQELTDSDYDLLALVWADNFELDFRALNASYIQRFVERVHDFNPIDPDCYVSIFNGHAACIGSDKLIAVHGVRYNVDANGEPLFRRSKETRFPVVLQFVVSHYFPLLYEPLNRVVESFWEAGFINLWDANYMKWSISIGKINAQRLIKSRGTKGPNDEEAEESNLSGFLFRIILLGSCLAILAFIYERIRAFFALLLKKVVNHIVGLGHPTV